LQIISTDRPALYQDAGRPGLGNQGVSESGAADLAALRTANELLGNVLDSVAVEITYGGFSLKAGEPVTCAVTGADVPIRIGSAHGRTVEVSPGW
jgi:allophanate hydrolase subunit 2